MSNKIIDGVKEYYSQKILANGPHSRGVDWNSKESQYIRFEQLCDVIRRDRFSILDYGCGYGELINFLTNQHTDFEYNGYDISEEMLNAARNQFGENFKSQFMNSLSADKYDYVVASGLFNVKLDLASNLEWNTYILNTICQMNELSRYGFSFNALTKYSDAEFLKDYLYYSDPLQLFDYCKKNFSKNVTLKHDYELYEFTIVVRKNG